jgi:hypothetical protein
MTWHRAGFHGGPLVELRDLLSKIQPARAAKEASTIPLRPSLTHGGFRKEAPGTPAVDRDLAGRAGDAPAGGSGWSQPSLDHVEQALLDGVGLGVVQAA